MGAHTSRRRLILFMILWPLVLAGCDGNDDPELEDGFDPHVQVLLMPEQAPLAGIKVVLMDPQTNTVVAGPVVSGQDGVCPFPGLEQEFYALLAFGGPDHQVVWQSGGWNYPYQVNDRQGMLPGDPLKTPPVPAPPRILLEAQLPPAGLPRIAGQVVDASTGEPLSAAFVSVSPYLTGYLGQTTYRDDVTGTDGRFSVSEIAFAQDPQSGNLVQVQPLFVAREGYRPLSWTHTLAHGDDDLDISGVTVPLQPLTAEDTGGLTGRLLRDGAPAPEVLVGLGGAADPDKGAAGQPGFVARTDTAGVFTFQGLPAGEYRVHPGFLAGDGDCFLSQQGNVGRQVVPGQVTDAGDLWLVHEIVLHWPTGGMTVNPESLGPLQWAAVPGAAVYQVFLDRGVVGTTDRTTIAIPGDWTLNPGIHSWRVVAYDAQEHIVGALDRPGIFYWPEMAP